MKIVTKLSLLVCAFLIAQPASSTDLFEEMRDAIAHDDITRVEDILIRGIDVNEESDTYAPLLTFAVARNNIEIVRLLVERGADLNARDALLGYTALHLAAIGGGEEGQEIIAQYLVSKGADIEAEVETNTPIAGAGFTPLIIASSLNHNNMVSELLDAGADINAVSKKGNTSLHTAIWHGHIVIVKTLIDHGANVNLVNHGKLTPLYLAAVKGNKEVVVLLVNGGANVNARNNNGITSLHAAIKKGYTDIAKTLIEKGADVNAKTNSDSLYVIHYAAIAGNDVIIELLINNGADINVRSSKNHTALDIARDKKNKKIINLLLQHGAESGRTSTWINDDGDF